MMHLFFKQLKLFSWWSGMLLTGLLTVVSMQLSQQPWIENAGISVLTVAIVLGIVIGNTFFPAVAPLTALGVDFSRQILLRAGIILYGFRITFQQITAIGLTGFVIDLAMVALVFFLALHLGTRVFRLDRQTSALIGAGSAICGAAAVMATEPVIRAPAHKVSVAVATVVVFGTLAMFIYPLLYPYLNLSEQHYGLFVGSTVHEVAQVVVAGKSVGETAAATAVIEKMLRVMLLVPFLFILSAVEGAGKGTGKQSLARRVKVPWFAVFFIIASIVNSIRLLPAEVVEWIVQLDTVLLAMAMAALGLRTHIGAVYKAGMRPLLLAAFLFLFLLVGGYGINIAILRLLG